MLRKAVIVVVMLTLASSAALAWTVNYLNYNEYGGTYSDAEKSPTNPDDDLMCWAAAASNVLAWTGWGHNVSDDADAIFAYFVSHWTDEGSDMECAWNWWFDGTNLAEGVPGWSQVDVPGGNFCPEFNFSDYFLSTSTDRIAMAMIEEYLRSGTGVAMALYGPGSHAVTCWGFSYDSVTGNYLKVWITDSDDSKWSSNPPDLLRSYDVVYANEKWYLQNFYGSNAWYIGDVMALYRCPMPEPTTMILVAIGGFGILRFARRKRV
jgi:hypothetical protein